MTPAIIDDEIRTLLDAPASGQGSPSLDDIEDTLTAGYAQALALDAERWRIERRLSEAAAGLSDEAADAGSSELVVLGRRLSATAGDLTQLRELLSCLRKRAAEIRSAAA
jgi:hypothetical protein